MHKFKELEIWKLSKKYCSTIYLATNNFPTEEKFGLINQMRRASIAIPSNIAEGSSRKSNKDFCRFLDIAIGSSYELETQLLIANDLNFLTPEKVDELIKKLNKITSMTIKFKTILQSKKD